MKPMHRNGENFMIFVLTFKKMTKSWGKTFLCFVLSSLLCSFFSPVSFAVSVPSELGRIRDRADGTNGKTVILVEEAHVDYRAQKAIAEVLRDLIENESLRLILVEGGWGDVSLTPFRSATSLEKRQEVAEKYLRDGRISGDEYLSLATDLDLELWGLENRELYAKNMDAFLAVSKDQAKNLGEVSKIQNAAERLVPALLTPALRDLWEKRRAFDREKLPLVNYVDTLFKMSPAGADRFPHLKKIATLGGLGNSYDASKVELEKQKAISFLSKQLTKPELESIRILQDRKTPEAGALAPALDRNPSTVPSQSDGAEAELYFLKALLKAVFSRPESKSLAFENLRRYTGALEEALLVDGAQIFSELEALFDRAITAAKPNPDQKQLLEILRGAEMLTKLFDLRLTVDEFRGMEMTPVSGRITSEVLGRWQQFMKAEFKKNHLGRLESPDTRSLGEMIPAATAFYETARKRDGILIQNALQKIEKENSKLTAILVGGFHSQPIYNALKVEGYTVLLVRPRFMPEDFTKQHEQYFQVLKSKWEPVPDRGQVPLSLDQSITGPGPAMHNLNHESQGGFTPNATQQPN